MRALYDNLQADADTSPRLAELLAVYLPPGDPVLKLAQEIDKTVRRVRPDDWRDNGGPREQVVKAALYDVLQDEAEVERIFLIIKAQKEY